MSARRGGPAPAQGRRATRGADRALRSHLAAALCVLALAGCGEREADRVEPPVTPRPDVASAAVEAIAGSYEFDHDGETITLTLQSDKTFVATSPFGEIRATGLWSIRDGKTCFEPQGRDDGAYCYATTPVDERGRLTATRQGEQPLTVLRL